jgi:hypothetical protein
MASETLVAKQVQDRKGTPQRLHALKHTRKGIRQKVQNRFTLRATARTPGPRSKRACCPPASPRAFGSGAAGVGSYPYDASLTHKQRRRDGPR